MKGILYKYSLIISFAISAILNSTCFAQKSDADNYRMLFNFNTIKQSDNTRLLEVSFIARNKKNRKDKVPVYNAEIKFFNTLNNNKILLGSAKTSKKGIAKLTIPENYKYLIDENGYINLKAQFEETTALAEQIAEINVKDLYLNFNLTEIDSVKTALITAYTIDNFGNKIATEDTEINFFVKGMLSKMPIHEEGLISDGKYEFEFPTDIPGDINGDLTVYAMILDNDEYWNITKSTTVNWGVASKQIKHETNKLWTEAAPIWMYILLTIMLVGVWTNYLYTIIHLFRIKKESYSLSKN
ncbi:hypothetical protein [Lutibacter sp.]